MNNRFLLGCCASLALTLSCAVGVAEELNWTPIFKGIELTSIVEQKPPLRVVVARIDLTDPDVAIKTTEPNPNFAPDVRETVRETTPSFLTRNNLALAVNGSYYTPFGGRTITKPGDANLRGLAVCDGFVESRPEPGFPSFVVKKDGKLEIRQYSEDEDLADVAVAISGPATVLKDGKVLENPDQTKHPRTAIGYSQDQKYLYLMTIDGRRPGYSLGATLDEVGAYLLKVGAYDGLNLDGGGSTTMAARNDDGSHAILNWPINAISPDGLRFNGNAIGVTAAGAPLTAFESVVELHNAGEPVEWTPAYDGIELASWIEYDAPLQRIFAARIDLTEPGVAVKSTAPHKDYQVGERETWRQTTAGFLADADVNLAINANFYSPFGAFTIGVPGDSNPAGLVVSDGFVVSAPQNGFPSFVVTKDGDIEIREVAEDEDLSGIAQAVSGNFIVLKNGEIVSSSDTAVHPRTAIGYSQDKRYLYFLVIDGRRNGYSVGANYANVAQALKLCGAYDGLNLDGGGSTTMAIRDSNGEPIVLNNPCNVTNDHLRYNANSIGVTASGKLKTKFADGRALPKSDDANPPKNAP